MSTSDKILVVAGTEEFPRYFCVAEDTGAATTTWMIVCDEGWRQSIVCTGMYDWVAGWLLSVLASRPFAPEHRPTAVTCHEA